MNALTVAALDRINRRFYDLHAETFSATRSQPWKGWQRATAPYLESSARSAAKRSRILDVGCGNGRFGAYLASAVAARQRYVGLDRSRLLLQQARDSLVGLPNLEVELRQTDLIVDTAEARSLDSASFDLVAMLGVLHHLPGLANRQRLLLELAGVLAPGGLLILSFWQFGRQSRFRRRMIDWSEHNGSAAETIDLTQLEPGDHLLAWGNQDASLDRQAMVSAPRRYCHHAGPQEAERLAEGLGLRQLDRFEADGRSGDLNLYFVLQAAI